MIGYRPGIPSPTLRPLGRDQCPLRTGTRQAPENTCQMRPQRGSGTPSVLWEESPSREPVPRTTHYLILEGPSSLCRLGRRRELEPEQRDGSARDSARAPSTHQAITIPPTTQLLSPPRGGPPRSPLRAVSAQPLGMLVARASSTRFTSRSSGK